MNKNRISFSCNQGLRENLEDAFGAFKMSILTPGQSDITFTIAVDGVGGNNYGEIASVETIDSIKSSLALFFAVATAEPDDGCLGPEVITKLLVDALNIANDAILQQAAEQLALKGMSTTVVCGLIVDDVLYVAWAGDSRCYIYSGGKIRRLTKDHSVVQQLIDDGLLDSKYAKCHPLSHTITRFVGTEDEFAADTVICKLAYGDIILLCTDGLTDVLEDEDIADSIGNYQSGKMLFKQLPHQLVRRALSYGTTDNVTVVCCEYIADPVSKSSSSTLTGAYPGKIAETLKFLKESTNV